jgi:hypothetical protein
LPNEICGYTDRQSVAPGETIGFCLANLAGAALRAPIRIARIGCVETERAAGIATVAPGAVPAAPGCESQGWPVGYEQKIGPEWKPGIYLARIGEEAGGREEIFFVVRNAENRPALPLTVQIPTTTMNAYNNWGGASLYPYNSPGVAATAVSFDRPQRADPRWPRGYGFKNEWELRIKAFVHWLEAMGYEADFITNHDLHERPLSIGRGALFISIGHDEYWTRAMRAHFDGFIAAGGNAAILGGNTCYWQIRLEADDRGGGGLRREVCYRSAAADPVADPALKTAMWRDLALPENTSFGAGFAKGAWRGTAAHGAFTLWQPDHWVFRNTGLRRGDQFGGTPDEQLLGYETNGVDYRRDGDGLPVPTGADGTPQSYRILALAELAEWGTPGNAALGLFAHQESGGIVFNAATTDWAKGFDACLRSGDLLQTVTARITHNVIARLAQPEGADASK